MIIFYKNKLKLTYQNIVVDILINFVTSVIHPYCLHYRTKFM